MPLLAAMARNAENASLLRHAAWLLSNLCRPKPQTDDLFTAIPTIAAILTTPDNDLEVRGLPAWSPETGHMGVCEAAQGPPCPDGPDVCCRRAVPLLPQVVTHSCWALAYLTAEEPALDDLTDPEYVSDA